MGASDILKNSDDLDSARLDRKNRTTPREKDIGQEENFGDDFFSDDFFGDSGGSTDFNDNAFTDFSSGSSSSFSQPQGQFQNQQPTNGKGEELLITAVEIGGKGIWSFAKTVSTSFKGLTPKFWSMYSAKCVLVGLGCSAIGLVGRIFRFESIYGLLGGGLLTTATGGIVLLILKDKAKTCKSEYKDEPTDVNANIQDSIFDDSNSESGDDINFDFLSDTDDSEEYEEDEDFFNEEYSDMDEENTSLNEDLLDISNINLPNDEDKEKNFDEELDKLKEVPKGMITRQYLFDLLNNYLEYITKDFANIKEIPEDSDVFIAFEQKLRESASVIGIKDDNLPELISLEENLLTIKMCATRPIKANTQQLAEELAKIYSYKDGLFDSNIYATADAVGQKIYITIFTGAQALVSLKDLYQQCKEFILDTSNYMPIVLGFNQLGRAIYTDFKTIESILVTGKPRTGKTWWILAVLSQMTFFVPPSELNIYIGDPKDMLSDFSPFKVPHVKRFESTNKAVVDMIRYLVQVEAPRRKKIIGEAGYVNIWDFKEAQPNVKIPVIYAVIDEVISISDSMEGDEKKEFQGLLSQLITQLPALGIRIFMIPHIVRDDIIKKRTTDMIDCRISVKGDSSHIESSTGAKPKDFPYKLTHKGDLAVKIAQINGNVFYTHGVALTRTNRGNAILFDFIRRVWSKLEPEEVEDSVAKDADLERDLKLIQEIEEKKKLQDIENTTHNFDSNSGKSKESNEDSYLDDSIFGG